MDALNDDTLHNILQFTGEKSFLITGLVTKRWSELFFDHLGIPKETFYGFSTVCEIEKLYEQYNEQYNNNDEDEEDDDDEDAELRLANLIQGVTSGIVKYGRSDLFEWSLKRLDDDYLLTQEIVDLSCEEGKLKILQTIFDNNNNSLLCDTMKDELRQDTMFFNSASRGRRRKRRKNHSDTDTDTDTDTFSNIEILKWLKSENFNWDDEECCSQAASNGNIENLKWLRSQLGCSWDYRTFVSAVSARRDNPDDYYYLLTWLHIQGCPWNEHVCAYAAISGSLETLKFLREHGCPWNDWTIVNAKKFGHSEILEWARANGCPERSDYDDDDGVEMFSVM